MSAASVLRIIQEPTDSLIPLARMFPSVDLRLVVILGVGPVPLRQEDPNPSYVREVLEAATTCPPHQLLTKFADHRVQQQGYHYLFLLL